MPSLCCSLLY